MARRLFTVLSALSLLLCVAVAVLWVRSYLRSDELVWTAEQVRDGVVLATRDTRLRSSRGWWSHSEFVDRDEWRDGPLTDRIERRSFEWRRTPRSLDVQFSATRFGGELPVPYWLICLVLLLPLGIRFRRPVLRCVSSEYRERERRSFGLCPACGYDLRATPDRCPECGTSPAAGVKA
jgi:hypothetical protein